MHLLDLPILSICGYSGSGKTTLVLDLLRRLRHSGLKIAVVKHTSKEIKTDRKGKDSYRFFSDSDGVSFFTKSEYCVRRPLSETFSIEGYLRFLCRDYDLVIVEGYKSIETTKILLKGPDDSVPDETAGVVLACLERGMRRYDAAFTAFNQWYQKQWQKTPLFGCILTGGKSSRMGSPKQLLLKKGRTYLETIFETLQPFCTEVVLAGQCDLPQSFQQQVLPDIPGAEGPLAGMLAALRWNPWTTWLFVACDMPDVQADSIQWLLQQRAPGHWAILPKGPQGRCEPLFALYDFRIHSMCEQMLFSRENRPSKIAQHAKVITPKIPQELLSSWRNINEPHEVE